MVHLPAVVGIESLLRKITLLGLAKQEKIPLYLAQFLGSVIPKGGRHQHRHIATETIHGMLREPKLHRLDLRLPHGVIRVVELRRIGPIAGHFRRAILPFVAVGVLLNPTMVACRMVSHPIQDYLHSQAMCRTNKGIQIRHRTHLGIDGAVIRDRVVGAERTFAPLVADRVDRHEPHGIYAHLTKPLQSSLRSTQRTARGHLADIHFIQQRLAAPFGMYHGFFFSLLFWWSKVQFFLQIPCMDKIIIQNRRKASRDFRFPDFFCSFVRYM